MSEQIEPKTPQCLPECKHTPRDWGHSESGAPSDQKIQPATDKDLADYGDGLDHDVLLTRIDADCEKIAALEAERENRKKSIPDLSSGIEQAQYIVAHADEFIDLAVHLATWALELHAQVGELHVGLGRTEANEAVILRAENAKMRKALERISRHDPNKISLVYDIAREALK